MTIKYLELSESLCINQRRLHCAEDYPMEQRGEPISALAAVILDSRIVTSGSLRDHSGTSKAMLPHSFKAIRRAT